MGLFINTNSYANNAQRNLLGSSQKLGTSFQRLSSGLRVNLPQMTPQVWPSVSDSIVRSAA